MGLMRLKLVRSFHEFNEVETFKGVYMSLMRMKLLKKFTWV